MTGTVVFGNENDGERLEGGQMRFLFIIGFITVLIGPARATESDGSMESMLELAEQRNPEIRAMRASVEAFRARPQSVRAWDNPAWAIPKKTSPAGEK
jgi:hypothetical protein